MRMGSVSARVLLTDTSFYSIIEVVHRQLTTLYDPMLSELYYLVALSIQ